MHHGMDSQQPHETSSPLRGEDVPRENHARIGSWGVYSQGQKHVIQLKDSQELITPNMSSQFQLGNSLELIFVFQLGDVN